MTRPYSQRGNREHEATPRGDPMRPARNQGGRNPLVPDAARPDAERDARRDLLERVREARSAGGVVVSLELLDEVAEELRRYSLLMQAVNESADDCDEKCDSHAHREDCKTHDPASWLIDARAENERLRAALAAERDRCRDATCGWCRLENTQGGYQSVQVLGEGWMHCDGLHYRRPCTANAIRALAAPPAAPEPTKP